MGSRSRSVLFGKDTNYKNLRVHWIWMLILGDLWRARPFCLVPFQLLYFVISAVGRQLNCWIKNVDSRFRVRSRPVSTTCQAGRSIWWKCGSFYSLYTALRYEEVSRQEPLPWSTFIKDEKASLSQNLLQAT